MKVAIVGSGIAGLAASHFLTNQGHQVHLYESQSRLGMAAQTITIPAGDQDVRGDVPSRMFNDRLWPGVDRLYSSLGLSVTNVDAKQSYRICDRDSALMLEMPFRWATEIFTPASIVKNAYAAVNSISRAAGNPLTLSDRDVDFNDSDSNQLDSGVTPSSALGNVADRRQEFLAEIGRLNRQGRSDLKTIDRETSFVAYLDRHRFSQTFRQTFLYPALSSTVCTCSHAAIENYPAVILLEAMQHISGDRRLVRVTGGTRSVVDRLIAATDEIFLNAPVQEVICGDENVQLLVSGTRRNYDHVVIASQANHAVSIFPQAAELERKTLLGFVYEDVEVVVHTDPQFMPPDPKNWATFNFVADDAESRSMCTVWMNRFHCDWGQQSAQQSIFQTIRPIKQVRSEFVLQTAHLQRPIVDARSFQLWEQLRSFHRQPGRRIWYCGSYAMPGIPLLESAVASAIEVSDAISTPR